MDNNKTATKQIMTLLSLSVELPAKKVLFALPNKVV